MGWWELDISFLMFQGQQCSWNEPSVSITKGSTGEMFVVISGKTGTLSGYRIFRDRTNPLDIYNEYIIDLQEVKVSSVRCPIPVTSSLRSTSTSATTTTCLGVDSRTLTASTNCEICWTFCRRVTEQLTDRRRISVSTKP